jgi:hypothetical protein
MQRAGWGMSGGEVLGTALIMWLKNEEDDIAVAKRVVKAVWRRMGAKRAPGSFRMGRVVRYQDLPYQQNRMLAAHEQCTMRTALDQKCWCFQEYI